MIWPTTQKRHSIAKLPQSIRAEQDQDKTKAHDKKELHIDSSEEHRGRSPYEAKVDQVNKSPEFNPTKLLNRQRLGQAGLPVKAVSAVKSTVLAF